MGLDFFIIIGVLIFAAITMSKNNPMNHSKGYRRRRFLNWFPLGLTYAFLYMGRYNLTVSKMALGDMMTKIDFGDIFAAGTFTYAFAFLINGPITDKLGGRFAILAASGGSAVMNGLMGLTTYLILAKGYDIDIVLVFSILYSLNMYFQSMGAVSIVKVNSYWFHVKERGVFGAIFGILISLGIYFAFDWGGAIAAATSGGAELSYVEKLLRSLLVIEDADAANQCWWVFFIPSIILAVFFVIDLFIVRNTPSEAGQEDIDTADASSGEMEQKVSSVQIIKKILTNPVILMIGGIEFCSGVLRNGIMHWYPIYMKETNKILGEAGEQTVTFFKDHWGLLLMCAGIGGGMFAGFISDKIFGSRRGPVAALLYFGMFVLSSLMVFTLESYYLLGVLAVFGSLCVIGVHGMLSGTATMDFGGRKGAATAVGVIDGMVYLGTGVQSLCLGHLTTKDWFYWPIFLVPFTLIGLVLAIKIWHAFPNSKRKGAH